MQTEQKHKIIEALETFMSLHSISQNDVAKKADVNASYLVNMRKHIFETTQGDKTIPFKDLYFVRLANFIGYELEESELGVKQTRQFKFIIAHLMEAKEHAETCVLIGQTGAGKTFTSDIFKSKFPRDVFSIKIGSSDNLSDVIDKISTALKLDFLKSLNTGNSKSSKIRYICNKLILMKENGLKPMLIFDEAEYMKQPSLCAYKEIYDVLLGVCPTILLGTPELTDNMERLIRRNKPGIAQLFRRLKFKIKTIPTVNTNFDLFLDGIEPEFKRWLQSNCANYGELTDVLTPCIRESKRLEEKLSLKLCCKVLGLTYETERVRR